MIRQVTESIQTESEARDVIVEASMSRGVDPERVLKAITFLEKVRVRVGVGPPPSVWRESWRGLLMRESSGWCVGAGQQEGWQEGCRGGVEGSR